MKFVYGAQRSPEGAHKRPFRKLKVAAAIIAAGIFAWGCQDGHKKLHLRESIQDSNAHKDEAWLRFRGFVQSEVREYKGVSRGYLEWLVLSHVKGGEDRLRTATSAERREILGGAVSELEASRLLKEGVSGGSDSLDSAIRREDSLFLVKLICEKDSVGLVDGLEYRIEPNSQVNAARWRDSLTGAILNTSHPMLPEARNRRYDSLVLSQAIASHVWKINRVLVENIFYDSTYANENIQDPRLLARCLDIYERMKLPDGSTRKADSLEIRRRFTVLQREYEAEQKEEEWLQDARMERKQVKNNNGYVPGSSRPELPSSGYYGNGTEYSAGAGRD